MFGHLFGYPLVSPIGKLSPRSKAQESDESENKTKEKNVATMENPRESHKRNKGR
jgi:hypothetical protein